MMIYDTLHKIEDFKKELLKNFDDLENLRITIQEKSLDEITIEVSVILTIPSKDHIIRHIIGKNFFNKYFFRDKSFEEYKKYKSFTEECYKKAVEYFGEITEGYWQKGDG